MQGPTGGPALDGGHVVGPMPPVMQASLKRFQADLILTNLSASPRSFKTEVG